jgi:hypothetical protein
MSNGQVQTDFVVDPSDLPDDIPKRPSWPAREGFTFIGDWAGPFYGTRRGWPISADDGGINSTDVDPKTLAQAAADLGCNCVIISCNLDLSVAAPQDSLDPIKQKIDQAHKHGLRVGVYLRADYFVPEAGSDEERKLEKFCQRDQRGLVPTWDHECHYKKKLCYHHPEVLDHFKGRLRYAVQELGADFVHIDGFDFGGLEAQDACRCDRCKEDFRAWLVRKYADQPDKAIERFGHVRLDGVEPPTTYPMVTVPDNLRFASWQEWILFRCWFSAKMGHEIARAVHELNPEAAIDVNIGVLVQQNHALLLGQDLPTMGRYTDGMFSEDAYWPSMHEDGKIITRIRQMKMLEASGGNSLLAYVTGSAPQDERQLRQSVAHMAAFNRGALGCLGFAGIMAGGMEYTRNHKTRRQAARWVRDHWHFYRPTEPFSEIAVWRSQRSLAFAPRLSYASFMRMEQLLIEDRVPFRIVFDEWLENHGRDRALLLPAVECLSKKQAATLRAFVENGGGVLIAEGTGTFDQDRRRRLKPLLGELFDESQQVNANGFMQLGRCGEGRVARIFKLLDPKTQVPSHLPDKTVNFCLDHTNWAAPDEVDQVRAALDWILGNDRKIVIEAPRGVLAEYRQCGDKLFIHLVNLRSEPALNVRLRVQGAAAAVLESPDAATDSNLSTIETQGCLHLNIDILDVYAVLTVSAFSQGDRPT